MSHLPRVTQLGSGGAGILSDCRAIVLNCCTLVLHQAISALLGLRESGSGRTYEPNAERLSPAALSTRPENQLNPAHPYSACTFGMWYPQNWVSWVTAWRMPSGMMSSNLMEDSILNGIWALSPGSAISLTLPLGQTLAI